MNDTLHHTDPILEEIWAIRAESAKRYEEDPEKWIEDLIAFADKLEKQGFKVVSTLHKESRDASREEDQQKKIA